MTLAITGGNIGIIKRRLRAIMKYPASIVGASRIGRLPGVSDVGEKIGIAKHWES